MHLTCPGQSGRGICRTLGSRNSVCLNHCEIQPCFCSDWLLAPQAGWTELNSLKLRSKMCNSINYLKLSHKNPLQNSQTTLLSTHRPNTEAATCSGARFCRRLVSAGAFQAHYREVCKEAAFTTRCVRCWQKDGRWGSTREKWRRCVRDCVWKRRFNLNVKERLQV